MLETSQIITEVVFLVIRDKRRLLGFNNSSVIIEKCTRHQRKRQRCKKAWRNISPINRPYSEFWQQI